MKTGFISLLSTLHHKHTLEQLPLKERLLTVVLIFLLKAISSAEELYCIVEAACELKQTTTNSTSFTDNNMEEVNRELRDTEYEVQPDFSKIMGLISIRKESTNLDSSNFS